MFPGMDPEMMKVAQEQMRKMKPEDLQRMQQMMTPEMTQFAMDSMRKMKPEEMRAASEQMKRMSPDQMAFDASGFDQAAAQMGQMKQYELSAATSLKNQGNQLHNAGKYREATEKYQKAKSNLDAHTSAEAALVKKACSLNLMSCFLKLGEGQKVVLEGSQVLRQEPNNVKALYRRGQAYKETGKLKLAVADLRQAAELSPADETLLGVLRDTEAELAAAGEEVDVDGEEMEEEVWTPGAAGSVPQLDSEVVQARMESLKRNPEALRGIHSMMSAMDPEALSAMSHGAMTPEMARTAASMMKNMSPEELEAMVNMGQGVSNAATGRGAEGGMPQLPTAFPGGMPQLTPEVQQAMAEKMKDPQMMSMMTEMMKGMDPDTLVRMSEQAGGIKLTQEQAKQAQEAMAKMTPDQLKTMMRFSQNINAVKEAAIQTKQWLLNHKLLVVAFVVLILGLLFQWLKVL